MQVQHVREDLHTPLALCQESLHASTFDSDGQKRIHGRFWPMEAQWAQSGGVHLAWEVLGMDARWKGWIHPFRALRNLGLASTFVRVGTRRVRLSNTRTCVGDVRASLGPARTK